MQIKELEREIRLLQLKLYKLGEQTDYYSSGEILRLSEKLDEKIIIYQKLLYKKGN
ncbi:Spo0E family sporulation regulatory protein-aspartic acid phosphatase [Sediminibacillus albus]|uniref:Spo0E like sporulation regulatory protein n=1 Tax=Sediminibacillus albus TaxID=407036 RepID=A0A1G8VT98_9BACI|nr:Spo0E family sporulation regulatory protein-aspartic acid phosphatase [Sediminibacillus albus]SDJ69047.1 Spo0E like sporulation regulatory protein [Sediminibacillus albus]